MINRKGEISAIVVLGMLIVMGIAAAVSSTVNDQRRVTDTRAATTSCANNPVPPPAGGYTWVANCSSSCTTNANCPQNTSDTSNVNPATSNWCYGFTEGAKCLQLQKGSGITQPPNNNQPTSTPNNPTNPGGTQGSICTVATGCGGACNSNWNQGCGYGGCRAWEDCVNNTCIDTTNLGTQSAGENACHSLATADSPENKLGQATPTTAPQGQNPTTIPTAPPQNQNVTSTPKATPTTNPACSQGYKWCKAVNECKLEYEPCPVGTNTPIPNKSCSQGYKWCPGVNVCSLEYESCPQPTPTQTTRITPSPTRIPTSKPVNSSQTQCSVGLSGFCVPAAEECTNFDKGNGTEPQGKWSTRSRSYGCKAPSGYCCAPKSMADQPEWTPTPTIAPTNKQTIKTTTEITGKACTGTVSNDNGCIDVYGVYPL